MSDNPKSKATAKLLEGLPFTMANVFGRQDLRETRLLLIFGVVAFVLVLGQIITFNMMRVMQADLANARDNQVAHLYPEASGVYVERKTMPAVHIAGFVSRFEDLYFNWAPESVRENMMAAERMMSQDYIFKNVDERKANVHHGEAQRITQVVSRIEVPKDASPQESEKYFKVEPLSHGYRITYKARKKRSVRGTDYLRAIGSIELIVQRIEPNAHYKWGLRVVRIKESWKNVDKK